MFSNSSLETKNDSGSFTQVVSFFFSDNAPVKISSVAKFVTGSPRTPATGLEKQITVKFKDDCLPKNRPGVCNCLPTVSTCEIILNIPEFTRGRDDECIQRCFDL